MQPRATVTNQFQNGGVKCLTNRWGDCPRRRVHPCYQGQLVFGQLQIRIHVVGGHQRFKLKEIRHHVLILEDQHLQTVVESVLMRWISQMR